MERGECKKNTERDWDVLWHWWEIHGHLVRDWWTGCCSGGAFEDEVDPRNFPCSLWGGSFILLVQEGKSLRVLSSKDIVWNGRHFVLFLHSSDSSEAWLVGGLCVTSTAPSPSQHDCTGSQSRSNEIMWSMLDLGCRRGGSHLPALLWGGDVSELHSGYQSWPWGCRLPVGHGASAELLTSFAKHLQMSGWK